VLVAGEVEAPDLLDLTYQWVQCHANCTFTFHCMKCTATFSSMPSHHKPATLAAAADDDDNYARNAAFGRRNL
jgi:hypothetical protein